MTIEQTPPAGDPLPRSGTGGGEPLRVPQSGPRPSARDLERYAGLFAARTRVMKSTAMRDLMALTDRPEVISLAGGLPDTSTFPPDSYAAIMSTVARDSCARALQYGPTEGFAITRERIVEVMAAEGTFVDPDDVLVTTGGQQVIDLVCKALIDPGDVIIAEAPTYPGAIPTFCAYEADVVQVEMDADGMRVDELEDTLASLHSSGRRPKFIYTIPNFQNPAGVTMSLPRRRRLVEVARERELLVLEDNPYGLLRYEGDPLPTLRALDGPSAAHGAGGLVVYLGTFSKILSPGVRLAGRWRPRPCWRRCGWARCPWTSARPRCPSTSWMPTSPRATGASTSSRCAGSTAAGATRCSTRSPSTSAPRRTGRTRREAVRVGDAARLHRHDRPARARAARERRLRARRGGLRRRARALVDAPELLRRHRGRDPRGRQPHRQGRSRPGRALRHAHRRAPGHSARRAARHPSGPRRRGAGRRSRAAPSRPRRRRARIAREK